MEKMRRVQLKAFKEWLETQDVIFLPHEHPEILKWAVCSGIPAVIYSHPGSIFLELSELAEGFVEQWQKEVWRNNKYRGKKSNVHH